MSLSNLVFPITPSPFDSRDFIYEQISSVGFRKLSKKRNLTPSSLDLRSSLNKPRNQGSRGTCAAFACAAIKEFQEKHDIDFTEYMSPNSIYFYRQPESGMYPRNVMKLLNNTGISPEKLFPYSGTIEPTEIPEEAKKSMKNHRIKSYAKVTTIDGLKDSLFKYGPAMISVPVYQTETPEIWRSFTDDQEMLGGHAMTIVGYNKKGFIVRNSWGDDWNGDGHVIFPYQDWGSQWEIWTTIDDVSIPEPKQKSCLCW